MVADSGRAYVPRTLVFYHAYGMHVQGYLGAAGVSPGQLRKVLRLFFRMPLLSIPLLRTLNVRKFGYVVSVFPHCLTVD